MSERGRRSSTVAAHGHVHSHFGDPTAENSRRLAVSLGLTLAFVGVEALAGLFGNSLALLTDAVHNLTDAVALGLSWYALRVATRPAHAGKTYGYHRVGILVALVNASTLALMALGVLYEAYRRLQAPPEVNAPVLILVGALAFVINLVTAWIIRPGIEHDLNVRSAFLHLMGDVLSTLGAVAAGVMIAVTGWYWPDPLASVLIAGLILWSAWGILRQTVHILLESSPADVDVEALLADVRAVDGVLDVHDLHIWSISENLRILTAHIVTPDMLIGDGMRIQDDINELLSREYDIHHATLQLECEGCVANALYCGGSTTTRPSG